MPEEYESVVEVGENAYISITDADAYFATKYGAEAWADLPDEVKDKLLITATQEIDGLFLKGRKYVYNQALNFPRYICIDTELQQSYISSTGINDGTIPDVVAKATCEEALALLQNTEGAKRRELQRQGVTSFTIGKLSESFGGNKAISLLSDKAKQLLRPWILGKVRIR